MAEETMKDFEKDLKSHIKTAMDTKKIRCRKVGCLEKMLAEKMLQRLRLQRLLRWMYRSLEEVRRFIPASQLSTQYRES